jgi:heme oxygenase
MQNYGLKSSTSGKLYPDSPAVCDLADGNWTLSKWLAAKTYDARATLISSVSALNLSLSSHNCVRLLIAHDRFRRLVGPAYDDPILHSMLYGFFSGRSSPPNDYREFSVESPYAPYLVTRSSLPQGLIPRMGWLYVSEFVDLGLAQLTHTAQFCGRGRLADFEERFEAWRHLRTGLDRLILSEADEEKLVSGARAAIQSYCKQLQKV